MAKRLLTFAVASLFAASAIAIPAKRRYIQVKQPDGTTLTITIQGDENFHFHATTDGFPLIKGSNGTYNYATLDSNGKLIASTQLAHNANERSNQENAFITANEPKVSTIKKMGAKRTAERNAIRLKKLEKRIRSLGKIQNTMSTYMAPATGGEGIGIIGKRKGLVILVNFKDVKMQTAHNNTEWSNFFNQEGYNHLGNSGSVHDYFHKQSYGKFDLTFDVVGPVTLSKNMAAYGANDSDGNDKDPAGMVYEACKLAASQVNFADYDWDGDGEVDQVFVIYAGYGEASYDDENTVWPHEWCLTGAGYNLTLNGVKIDTYGCSQELFGASSSTKRMDGIGTACHEFSHCMGLPDIYDTDYSGGYGMGNWDVMSSGSYGGDGYNPVGYNSYEKWVSGWLQPTELKSPQYVTGMKALNAAPEAYVIYNEKTPTEYYLLENRQQVGTDSELPAHGLLVLHVDYDKSAWENNTLNNNKYHQRLTIIPADGVCSDATESGDTYPGTKGNTSLTDTSSPAAKLFNANTDGRYYMGKPITDIAESNSLISFTFMNGEYIETPIHTTSTVNSTSAFTASWAMVDNAESYNLQLKDVTNLKDPSVALTLAEDFSTWGKDFKGDGNIDISSELDDKTTNAGWTGEKVFESKNCAKLGSSKAPGNLTSPAFEAEKGSVTVGARFKAYGNDAATITVKLLTESGSEVASRKVDITGNLQAIHFDNVAQGKYKVRFIPTKRAYLYAVNIYNGEFSEDDLNESSTSAQQKIALRAVQSFNGITTNQYNFTGLNEGNTYQWRVQGVKGKATSEWSAWQKVDLSYSTSISSVEMPQEGDIVEIYATTGLYLGKTSFGRFMSSNAYKGVYLLRNAQGKAVKIAK